MSDGRGSLTDVSGNLLQRCMSNYRTDRILPPSAPEEAHVFNFQLSKERYVRLVLSWRLVRS